MPRRLLSHRSLLFGAALFAPPLAWTYHTVRRLEAKYPPCPLQTASTTAFRTPIIATSGAGFRLHSPYADVYATRVPVAGLEAITRDAPTTTGSIEEAWARTFLENLLLRAEGRAVGLGTAGDCGENGFYDGQKLLNGLFVVLRPPSQGQPLLVGWTVPEGTLAFFRRIAAWGYPWRIMSGGRHEWNVGEVDAEGMVEVAFSAAHDYEYVEAEGASQKTIPEWIKRLHKAYAMYLLDERAEEIGRRAKEPGNRQ